MLCIIKPFSACQPSYLSGVHGFKVQGFTINLNGDSIVLVIEDCNLRFICYLELVIWDFKGAPKPFLWGEPIPRSTGADSFF